MEFKKEIEKQVLKLLVLEDSKHDLELMTELLSEAGYVLDLTYVKDEAGFCKALDETAFDVIISDFNLPGFDAFGSLEISKKKCPQVPFICFSGAIGAETAIELLKMGAVDYVLKDRPERLPFAIKRAIIEAQEKEAHSQAARDLKESEQKFRNLFQNHAAVKLLIDPDTGNIVEANEAASQFYGWSVKKLQQMNMSQINTLQKDVLKQEMQNAISLRKFYYEFKHRKADESLIDVEVFTSSVEIGGKLFLHSIIHDISEKKKAQERVELLKKAIESSNVAVCITDIYGKLIYVNPFFEKSSGYTSKEVLGKNPRIQNSGHHSESFYENLWNTILAGNDWEGEMLNKRKNGDLYWVNTNISPIKNDQGAITHFVAIMEDTSDRKKLLEMLVFAKEKAEENDKLKTAFLNNISHEIRTPLNGILGFGQILTEWDVTLEERKELFKYVQQSSNRLMNTVSDYMDMAMIVSCTIEIEQKVFELQPHFQEITDKVKPLCALKKIEFITEIPPRAINLSIQSDPDSIRKILEKLLDNAIKFTQKGSIQCGYHLKGDFVEFYVQDTGIGISSDKLELMFEMFTQEVSEMTRGHEGSGLGLAIARGFVTLLGGEIYVSSTKGEGSKFSFTIPVNGVESPLGAKKNQPAKKRKHLKPLILIAEDDELNYEYFAVVLKTNGYKTLRAVNGLEAVSYCRQNPKISIVLMDIKMPVLDGIEATRLIRKFKPELPIIATTAHAQPGDQGRFLEAGCNDYLSKPVNKERLLSLIRKHH
ncbi:MAG TPA: PAS domain S-box protein [Bacteroidales bacterium]|nr:PAS domain S-box protein [Bacteroidales bacterium]